MAKSISSVNASAMLWGSHPGGFYIQYDARYIAQKTRLIVELNWHIRETELNWKILLAYQRAMEKDTKVPALQPALAWMTEFSALSDAGSVVPGGGRNWSGTGCHCDFWTAGYIISRPAVARSDTFILWSLLRFVEPHWRILLTTELSLSYQVRCSHAVCPYLVGDSPDGMWRSIHYKQAINDGICSETVWGIVTLTNRNGCCRNTSRISWCWWIPIQKWIFCCHTDLYLGFYLSETWACSLFGQFAAGICTRINPSRLSSLSAFCNAGYSRQFGNPVLLSGA